MKPYFAHFWLKNPALMVGIVLLLGTAYALDRQAVYLIVLGGVLFFAVHWRRIAVSVLLFAAAIVTTSIRCPECTLPMGKMKGTGTLSISNLKAQQSPFQRSLLYKGTLSFRSDAGFEASRLPCNIYLPSLSKRPTADCDYMLAGTLVQKGKRLFIFKPDKAKPWTPIPGTFSLAEWRFCAKQAVHNYLKRHIPDSHTRIFLNALATGEIDERILSLEFGRLGLQHILAISGFHFALIAVFFGALLRTVFSYRSASVVLLFLLSSYCFFLGNSPSVQRAWLAILIVLSGRLFNLRTSALNALGVGLCVEIVLDPLVVLHMGFQLSFLCTLAILMLYPIASHVCNYLLPQRTFPDVVQMPLLDQHGCVLASLLRQTLAITLAVQIASLPVLLFLFHRFPLLSLVYNFFFPLWASISMLLLCCALLFALPVPPLSALFHQINSLWTGAALEISSHPPAMLDFVIRTKDIPYSGVVLFLAGVFLYAIYWNEKKRNTLFSM